MGNKNKRTKSTNTGMSRNSSISSTNKSEDPTKDNPMDLLQKLTTYIQGEEKDSSALKSEIQALKKQLQESQDESRASQLSAKNFEKKAKELRDINQTQAEVTGYLVKDLQEECLKLQKHKDVSQGAIAKLLMDMHQAEMTMQSERITTAQLRRQFEEERLKFRKELITLRQDLQYTGGELKGLGQEHGREMTILGNQLNSMRQESQVVKRQSEKLQDSNRISDDLAVANQPRQNAPTNASEDEDDDGNLLVATLSELEDSRTPSNQPLENKVGILNGLNIEFCDGIEQKIVKLDLSPEQTERMHIWKQSLMEISNAKITSQEEYRTLAKEWHDTYTPQDNSDIALVLQWNTKPRDEMIIQQIQATNALEQKMEEKISLLQQQLDIAKTEISKEKMKTLKDQESMMVSHNMAIAGKKAEARIQRLQERRKIEKLKEAQEIEINTLKADFESQFAELEKKYRPIFDIGESILAREREKSKPYSERNEEIIDQGNLAAHGGNCLAVSQKMAKNSIDEDKKWFETSYGVSIENFTRHQNSSAMVKALNMRYSTRKFKFVQLSETDFESRFQLLMKKVREWEDHFEKTLGEPSESLDTFLTEDEDAVQIFSAICRVYNDAAESDKKRRKVEWKKVSG